MKYTGEQFLEYFVFFVDWGFPYMSMVVLVVEFLSEGYENKKCAPKMIFSKIGKIHIIFDIEN